MAFFQFGRKIDLIKEYSLEEIPVFSSLTVPERKLIEKKARLIEYKRGDLVYSEGTPADAFFVVVSGRFRVFTHGRGDQTLLELYRGDHFGETSLLTGKLHSASVEAKSDGLVLRLEKDDFLEIVNDIPAVSLYLSRSLGHRLTKSEDESGRRREVKIAALYALEDSENIFQLWLDFVAGLVKETKRKVILVDFVAPLPSIALQAFDREALPSFDIIRLEPRESDIKSFLFSHPSGFCYLHVPIEKGQEKEEKKIGALLTHLTYRFDYLMLRLPSELNHMAFRALKQSDIAYVSTAADAAKLGACAEILTEFQRSFGFGKTELKVLIPSQEGEEESALSYEERERILGHRIFGLIPSRKSQSDRYHATLRFLAKELAGTLIGLALGSGAAYGLAHIGVLRVLEKENIAVDVIAGSSIGALVGGLWAAGYSSDELETLAHSIDRRRGFFKLLGFHDFSIAHRGFFKGHQVSRFMESYLGNKTFQDLKIPLKITAANLFTSEEVVFEAGRIVDAIRASISIPGIFRPHYHKGEYLIDGGVIDPLPVRVLSKMGVKKIIAVNVLLSPEDRQGRMQFHEEKRQKELGQMMQRGFWSKLFANFLNRVYDRYSINIFNVIMHTIQFMEFEMAETWGKEADVLIHPVVAEGHWAEFYSPEKFIRAGEEKTREQLAEIKRLLTE